MAKAESKEKKKEKQLELGASMSYRIPLKMDLKDFDYLVSMCKKNENKKDNRNNMITEAIGVHRIFRNGSNLEKLTLCFGHKEAVRMLEMINSQGIEANNLVETHVDQSAAEEQTIQEEQTQPKNETVKLSPAILRSVGSYGAR